MRNPNWEDKADGCLFGSTVGFFIIALIINVIILGLIIWGLWEGIQWLSDQNNKTEDAVALVQSLT